MLVMSIYLLPALPSSFPISRALFSPLSLFECMLETNTLHHQTDFLNLCLAVSVCGCERLLSFLLCVEG